MLVKCIQGKDCLLAKVNLLVVLIYRGKFVFKLISKLVDNWIQFDERCNISKFAF